MGNSYIDKEDPAIYVKFPVKGKEKTYFLAWTTTPWTLPANTGLSVNPELMYVSAKIEKTGETLIFAEARQSDVLRDYLPIPESGPEFQITDRWKGTDLAGMHYEPLYQFVPAESDVSGKPAEAYRVVMGEHVTAEDGTGIVHTAPAFGEEDFTMAHEHGLPLIDNVDEEGKMIGACGPFAGLKIHDANEPIMDDLQSRGLLYRRDAITHSVPVCWRCSTLLLYKAQPAWFVNVTKLKPKMMKTAEKIHWHPEHFKDGRFGKGIETAPDWNISRTRYWGSPLPVWECEACGERSIVSSVAELKKKARKETWPEAVDLHRPTIDRVTIPCLCGQEQHRIPEVFDCWFESGSAPVAMLHYPFENKTQFEKGFPADFIGEGQDQTRGWFYTLHVLAAGLFNKPAFLNVIVTGIMLAEDGRKMSKSLKNYPDPWDVLAKYGADALRYYFLTSPIVEADTLFFSERDLQSVVRGFINILWNVKTFFSTYGQDNIRPSKPLSAHVLDRWLYARFMQVLGEVTHEMDAYQLAKAARPLRTFVDDLSTWWLRRSRDRLKSENEFERMDALKTLREILEEFSKVAAPFIPFISEKIYLDIGGQKASVHLEKWPKLNERLIDERLLQDMQWVRGVVSKGHEARAQAKIAVRQALNAVKIQGKDEKEMRRLQQQEDLLMLVREELNVESVLLEANQLLTEEWVVELDTTITPELKKKGMKREFMRQVMSLRKEAGLQPADRVNILFKTEDQELQDLLMGAADEMKRELRTERFETAVSVPSSSRASLDAKVGDKTLTIWLM